MALLTILISASAATAIAFDLTNNALLFAVFKPLTTVLIIVAMLVKRRILPINAARTFLGGLVACLLGDILLLNEAYFVAGLSAFLVAHLLFLRLFVILGGWSWNPRPLFILLIAGGSYFYYLLPMLGGFTLPVGIYSLIIILMTWQGINLSFRSRVSGSTLLAAGAVLFMFSDSMIALNKFAQPFELSVVVILASYWLALMFIVNGVLKIAGARIKP